MMKQWVLACMVGGVGLVACATASREERAKSEQALTGEEEAGDGTDAGAEAAAEADTGPAACAHPICAAGAGLDATCDPCATKLCAADPYCCNTQWDATCVGEVGSICGQSCTAPPPPDSGTDTCTHPICAVGVPLVLGCGACTVELCTKDPFCCAVTWDATCVGEVSSICGLSCN